MASCARERHLLNDKDTLFVSRLVYDVIVYTLPICGFPKKMLPTTDWEENVYNRANLVKMAGALILQGAVIMRDKWKRMFKSRLRSSGFNEQELQNLLGQLLLCCPLNRDRPEQSAVNVYLASCNEMILFCHHESMDIDPILLIKLTASFIILKMSSKQNISKEVEELFCPFQDIWKYTRWLTDFIGKFAIPYGSRDDVSETFAQHDDDRMEAVINETYPVMKTVKKLQDRLGFLPHDAFLAIAVEGSNTLPENLELAFLSTLPGDRESPEPPKWPDSFKSGAVGRRKRGERLWTRSADV